MDEQEQLIHETTGLNLCDHDCDCGANNGLWWFPVAGKEPPAWVPDWMNGAGTNEIWPWLESNKIVTQTQQPSG